MNLPNDTFCVVPWISLEATPTGTVRPCCLAEDELRDDLGHAYRLTETSFEALRDCSDLIALRKQFLEGQRPKTCAKCWAEEAAGRVSKRMHTLTRLQHIIPADSWTTDAKPLQFLDLKLGNICNLKCRICGSWSSSTAAVEELKFSKDKKDSYHYSMLKLGAWPRAAGSFWQQLGNDLTDLRYIEFTGGEPFLIEEHFALLKQLIDQDLATRIELHYNTNGTVYPEEYVNLWSQFKLVEIAVSVDDVGDRFEYQRANAKWEQIVENIERFKTLKQWLPSLRLQFCITVNIFNVYDLEHIAVWTAAQGFDYVYWNMLHERREFSIGSLPVSVKQIVQDRLESSLVDTATRQQFDDIVRFMQNGTSLPIANLLNLIELTDLRRGENLKTVAPRWAEILYAAA